MISPGELKAFFSGGGRARPLFFFSVLFAIVVFLASYLKDEGIRDVWSHDRELETRLEDLKKIESENAELRAKIRSVRDGSYLMEKYAREKLMMARPNEVVFRFYETAPGEPQPQ